MHNELDPDLLLSVPWAEYEAKFSSRLAGCLGGGVEDENDLCRQFDSEVINERKPTADRIKEVQCPFHNSAYLILMKG